LTELDGFKKTDNVIVIGATNLIESMDSAIKRPGRFDKIINISLPDVKGREEILDYYLSKIGTAESNDLH
jgi:ATP-dependent metalloprotease